ncbi:hypothetical protein MMC13_004683 [Lambiella insularis]|nr:hypothetical protein [Lambiella insularis]
MASVETILHIPSIRVRLFELLLPNAPLHPTEDGPRSWRWPQNSLLVLAAIFLFLKDEIYHILCSRSIFEVTDEYDDRFHTVTSSVHIAMVCFQHLGLQYFRHVRNLHFNMIESAGEMGIDGQRTSIVDALQVFLAHCSPTIKLKHFPLSLKRLDISPLSRIPTRSLDQAAKYVLENLEPLRMVFFVPADRVTRNGNRHIDLRKFNQFRKHPVDFTKILPLEVRLKIYGFLMEGATTEYRIASGDASFATFANGRWESFRNFLLVSREMKTEICRLLYTTCVFHFENFPRVCSDDHFPGISDMVPYSRENHDSKWCLDFLARVGPSNAQWIRNIRIELDIFPVSTSSPCEPLIKRLQSVRSIGDFNIAQVKLLSTTITTPLYYPRSPDMMEEEPVQQLCTFEVRTTATFQLKFLVWGFVLSGGVQVLTFFTPRIATGPVFDSYDLEKAREALQASVEGKVYRIDGNGVGRTFPWEADRFHEIADWIR